MFTSIFILAVVISAFFDQQQRRHRLELQVEYEKLGRKMPEEPPKLPMLESLTNIVIGLILAEIGGLALWTVLDTARILGSDATGKILPTQTDFSAASLAGGIALIILGTKGVVANLRSWKKTA